MPTIQYAKSFPDDSNSNYLIAEWTGLASGDDGQPIKLAQYADRTVQVSGVFDGATVTIEGSINGVDFVTLTDPQGNGLVFASGRIEAVTEVSRFLRPVVSGGGASTALNVGILLR